MPDAPPLLSRFVVVLILGFGIARGAFGAPPGEAGTPVPLSAVFQIDETVGVRRSEVSAGTVEGAAVSAAVTQRPPTPTPFEVDPLCPPSAIPPVALLPTPTPIPTPRPTRIPVPLPPGMRPEDLYAPPGHLGRVKAPEPLLRQLPGLMPDRDATEAEVRIENQWKRLCVALTFARTAAPSSGSGNTTSASLTLLYAPGWRDEFRLPPGKWSVTQRVWEPEPPYPEKIIEWPTTEIDARGRYVAKLVPQQEDELYRETHPVVVNDRERRERDDPLSRLGRPEETPENPMIEIGRRP